MKKLHPQETCQFLGQSRDAHNVHSASISGTVRKLKSLTIFFVVSKEFENHAKTVNSVSLNREVDDVAFNDLSPEAQVSAILNNGSNISPTHARGNVKPVRILYSSCTLATDVCRILLLYRLILA